MWCANCQADVAAEVSADNRHVRCATCSTVLDTPQTLRASARTREARELLERWSSGMMLDPYTPTVPLAPATNPGVSPELPTTAASAATGPATSSRRRTFRVDNPHSGILGTPLAASTEASAAPAIAGNDGSSPGAPTANAPRTVLRPRPLAAVSTAASTSGGSAPLADFPGQGPGSTDSRPATLPLPAPVGRTSASGSMDVEADAEAQSVDSGESFESDAGPSTIPAPHTRRPRAPRTPTEAAAPATVSHRRRDNAESLSGPRHSTAARPRPESGTRTASGHVLRFDDPQAPLAGPHIDPQSFLDGAPRRANSTSLAGQFLAYAGVLGMTVGTAMVLWGYFGGPEHFTPTGWLITTVGQMLLFLGVVTLVSGGMEQTTDEVARRIDHLGERLLRMEQTARENQWRGHDSANEASEERAAVG